MCDFETGINLLKEQRYEDAIFFLEKCAQKNNLQAQYEVGRMLKEGLGINKNNIEAKKYLIKSYKQGFKKSEALLRKIRYEEYGELNNKIDTKFKNKTSNLGFNIDIPIDWIELNPNNTNCFDCVSMDGFNEDSIFSIKMQVFLIEIPDNMTYCCSLERVYNNMGCIESVDFYNGHCSGKLICGECIDGTCNYIFISKGKKGVYDLRVIVDKYLENIYEDIIDHVMYSFDIIDKL